MNPTDILDLFDRLDVPGLAILTGYGFWKMLQLMNKVSNNLTLVEQKLTHIDETLEKHMDEDKAEHRRLQDKIELVKDRSYGNVAGTIG